MNHRMIASWAVIALAGMTLFAAETSAQTKRALLIGINTYQPQGQPVRPEIAERRFSNLEGPVNDVESMREILTKRFGFDRVVVLTNQQAKRQAILDAIQKELIDPATRGDVSVFYYAGHGSQVRNSLSDESDRLDESIVPADVNQGAPDIRDKELRRYFNGAVDKGVLLTAIFDSCNSGSIARGPGETRRAISPDTRDVQDKTPYGDRPETRGALIVSAAQDSQSALETIIDGLPRGMFTHALTRVLASSNATAESAQNIFSRVRALMQSNGRRQEPVLAGLPDRLGRTLFGVDAGTSSGRIVVAAGRVNRDGTVELQGGAALGFAKGTELRRIGSLSDAVVRVRVTEVAALNRSLAQVVEGRADNVQPGDAFEIVAWVWPESAILRVWIPITSLSETELTETATALGELRRAQRIQWVDDPAQTSPTHFVSWERGSWYLFQPGGASTNLGAKLTPSALTNALPAGALNPAPRLFINFPITPEMARSFRFGSGTPNDAIEVVSSPELANYHLVGRLAQGGLEYAWVLPRVFEETDPAANSAPAVSALPSNSEWVAHNSRNAGNFFGFLTDTALRLGRIRSWLRLESPQTDMNFAYRLALKQVGTGRVVSGGELRENESYGLVLRLDPVMARRFSQRRFVYVFSVDSNGKGSLLFPRDGAGSVENSFPRIEQLQNPPAEIPLGPERLFYISPPFGVDTFVLVSSEEQIPDTTVFEFEGVNRSQTRAGGETELTRLLRNVGAATRGTTSAVSLANWSIERVVVRSVPGR